MTESNTSSIELKTPNKNLLICEDDEEEEKIVRCDAQWEKFPGQTTFPYMRYNEFLEEKSLLKRLQRIKAIKNGETVPNLGHFTEDVLIQEFISLHGPIKRKTKECKHLFRTFKAERLEEIQEWITEEDSLTPEQIQNIEFVSKSFGQFSEQEIQLFESVAKGPKFSLIDPFVLPRRVVETSQLNLAIADPEIQCPNFIPLSKTNLPGDGHIVKMMFKVMQQFPLGIKLNVFVKKLNEELKKNEIEVPGWLQKQCENSMSKLKSLVNEVYFAESSVFLPKMTIVLFPTKVQGIVATPDDIFFSIWHKVKILLALNDGVLRLDNLTKLLLKAFNLRISEETICGWGFEDFVSFFKWLFQKMPVADLKMIQKGTTCLLVKS